jgi:transitional endoplasmic reticulum ATPase
MRDSLEATTSRRENVATARERVRPSLDPVQVAWLSTYAKEHQPG